MRRADRLLQIIFFLRARRFTTARVLAETLEVSERTIYRDIQELYCCGVPIDGEAGVGYRLRQGYDLPPLMFDRDELEALRLGARMVKTWTDPELAEAATRALTKIEAALPQDRFDAYPATHLYAHSFRAYPVKLLAPIRRAINAQRKIDFSYQRADGVASRRIVHPLGLVFWGEVWTLIAWCELRDDFRHFRLDRVQEVSTLDERYESINGRTLQDFFKQVGRD